jgi:hypothetical protein
VAAGHDGGWVGKIIVFDFSRGLSPPFLFFLNSNPEKRPQVFESNTQIANYGRYANPHRSVISLPPSLDLRGRHLRASAFFSKPPLANNTEEMWKPAAASSSRCGDMERRRQQLISFQMSIKYHVHRTPVHR